MDILLQSLVAATVAAVAAFFSTFIGVFIKVFLTKRFSSSGGVSMDTPMPAASPPG